MSYSYTAASPSTGYVYTYDGTPHPPADPYVYDTGTLKNKLGITDYAELCAKEREILADKIITPELVKSKALDVELLKSIHKYIFDEVFDWAGEIRLVPIYKGERYFISGYSIKYTEPQNVPLELKEAIYNLNSIRWEEVDRDHIPEEFALKLARIWKIHPFRDGNTRAVLGFAKVYAIEHHFPMNIKYMTSLLARPVSKDGKSSGYSLRDMFVGACLEESPQPQYLIDVFKKAIQ